MDGYSTAYIAHNVPFIVVSGLERFPPDQDLERPGFRITSDILPVETSDSKALLKHFQERDSGELAWSAKAYNGKNRFKIVALGREYLLPPRSAQLHAPSARLPESRDITPIPRPVAHSPLSPLSPDSPLFPDGLVDPMWVEKHQNDVPSAYVCFYQFTSDPKLSTLHDNQLKTDISGIKAVLGRSGYRTRLIVVLLSEGSIIKSPDVEERLANIRKATGLDSKTSLFFLPPQSSPVEIEAFVDTILTTIYPLCIEYYRDLSKHSRRKRNRGVVPPPSSPPTSGTSQALSAQDWNVRYDFKLGIFAEFRQEMDSAVRSFESGYDGLLTDVMESIAFWSPRWNEARLLADVFAIRILRCLLWNGNTTGAVRRWQAHRDRLKDFVNNRGKGSATYGWAAWESRWAIVMAEIIQKAEIIEFCDESPTFFLPPDKETSSGESLEPWNHLHHPGYWFRLASQHLVRRRSLARAIAEEDRISSEEHDNQKPTKEQSYDTYLCPKPSEEYPLSGDKGVDHALLIVSCLDKAIAEFKVREQTRIVQELSILSATESMRREDWESALRVLRPLWQKMTFRKEGWWGAVEEVGWALRNTAARVGDGVTVVSVDWELLNRNFVYRPQWHYDLTRSLDGLDTVQNKPVVVLHQRNIHSFLSSTYAFESSEGKVGETCSSQLVVFSTALAASVPVTISEIKVEFEGSMRPLILRHISHLAGDDSKRNPYNVVSPIETTSESGRLVLVGEANLVFYPGESKVFELSWSLREAGEASATTATFSLAADLFDLEYIQSYEMTRVAKTWFTADLKKKTIRAEASLIVVLPKPPKMEVQVMELQEQYYTNESIILSINLTNGEDFDSIASAEAWLLGEGGSSAILKLTSLAEAIAEDTEPSNQSGLAVGRIARAATAAVQISIPPMDLPSTYEMAIKVSYHLESDLDTPIFKSETCSILVINPFEANYDFSPRVHPDPWPSFFSHDEGTESKVNTEITTAYGLAQKWCLTSRYFSFAIEDLIVEDLDIEIIGTNGGIQCYTKKSTILPAGGVRVVPKTLDEAEFNIFTQKISLDDRGAATVDVSLAIKWRRDIDGSTVNTTVLGVPRLAVSSSEPRVLAGISYSATDPSMILFDVIMENPSNHFLTFGVTMEPSEKFAFSGVKTSTIQLVPISRRTITFRILPYARGDWLGPVRCIIRDMYFQRTLKIAPTEGIKLDKEGLLIWVPPPDDDPEEGLGSGDSVPESDVE